MPLIIENPFQVSKHSPTGFSRRAERSLTCEFGDVKPFANTAKLKMVKMLIIMTLIELNNLQIREMRVNDYYENTILDVIVFVVWCSLRTIMCVV
jgi:hypothetical protein